MDGGECGGGHGGINYYIMGSTDDGEGGGGHGGIDGAIPATECDDNNNNKCRNN